MGNPCFYWYPVAGKGLHTADFGALRLSDLQVRQLRDVSDSVSRSGATSRDVGGMRLSIQIVAERFVDDGLVRKLRNMQNHLERGGAVGFCLDTARLWAGYASGHSTPGNLYQGHRVITVPASNSWSSWSAGSLADDDPITIQSAPPESIMEHHTLNGTLGATATTVNLDNDTENDYHQTPFLVRYRDFWPALKLDEAGVAGLAERAIVLSHRRLNHTLDVTLVEDWATLRTIQGRLAPLPGTSTQSAIKYGSPPISSSIGGTDYSHTAQII